MPESVTETDTPFPQQHGANMSQNAELEQIYAELRRRAVNEYGEARAVELEDYLRTTAQQIADVEQAYTHPDLEPLVQG